MENLILKGVEAPCFINFDNVEHFYLYEQIYYGHTSFHTAITLKNTYFEVEETPEIIMQKIKKNKFIEFESGDYSTKDHTWNMANGKFYINVNSIQMIELFRHDRCLVYLSDGVIEVKGTLESNFNKLKTL